MNKLSVLGAALLSLGAAWASAPSTAPSSAPAGASSAQVSGKPTRRVHADVERCIPLAARHHRVNVDVLRAIFKVESSLNPHAVGRNTNGSVDVGLAQINSLHFAALAKYGIKPDDLFDPCIGAYVGAWILSKSIAAHGNTWSGVATYHSATPHHNARYQGLLIRQMVKDGVLPKAALAGIPQVGAHPSATTATRAVASQPADRIAVIDESPEP